MLTWICFYEKTSLSRGVKYPAELDLTEHEANQQSWWIWKSYPTGQLCWPRTELSCTKVTSIQFSWAGYLTHDLVYFSFIIHDFSFLGRDWLVLCPVNLIQLRWIEWTLTCIPPQAHLVGACLPRQSWGLSCPMPIFACSAGSGWRAWSRPMI